MRLTGMPIITAPRSTVSMASDGWWDHHSSVLAMLSVRTFLLGSDVGSSLGNLLTAGTARVGGMCWASQGFTVVGQTNKLDGSNPGGGGGAGLLEFLRSACWMGVDVGLEAEGPVVVGVEVSTVSPPTLWRSCANWLRSWVSSCWVSGSVVQVGTQLWMRSAICWAAYHTWCCWSCPSVCHLAEPGSGRPCPGRLLCFWAASRVQLWTPLLLCPR